MGDRQSAIAFFNQGAVAANDQGNPNRLNHAYQLFSSACVQDPTWWESYFQAGNANSDLNLLPAAVACWRRALQCEATSQQRAKILTNLSWRLHGLGRSSEALICGEQAVKLDDTLAYAWTNLSCIHLVFDDAPAALRTAERAYALSPQDALVETAYAFALLQSRRLADGLRHFEARFPYKLKNFLTFPYPKWEGEPDRQVYLVADQGLGDTLSYARFVPAACARAKYVHAYVQPELLRLFQHAFAGVPNLNLVPSGNPFPPADCWTTFVSLPFALGLDDAAIRDTPQIAPPVFQTPVNWQQSALLQARRDRKLHVGIAWAGSPLNDIDKHRNIPVDMFLELYRVPGVQLYSLQVGERARDMHDAGIVSIVLDLVPYVRDVVDTVSILRDLDLVICCESALGHICALVQKECWVPYSYMGRDYRIGLTGDDMIWTPQHRIFRQGPDRDWRSVFMRMCEALGERIREQSRSTIGEWRNESY